MQLVECIYLSTSWLSDFSEDKRHQMSEGFKWNSLQSLPPGKKIWTIEINVMFLDKECSQIKLKYAGVSHPRKIKCMIYNKWKILTKYDSFILSNLDFQKVSIILKFYLILSCISWIWACS